MRFELTILGCNAAIPAYNRHPTSQLINVDSQCYLVDCGEGTQIQMNKFQIRRSRINQIFISHLHGDHCFGLIGLLTSYSLAGRKTPIEIFAPRGLEEMIRIQLRYTGGSLGYTVHFHVLETQSYQKIFEDPSIEVFTIPVMHRIPTVGFLFKEKTRPLNVIPEKLKEYKVPIAEINKIKEGRDFITENGQVVANPVLTLPAYKNRSYAYCADTLYTESILTMIEEVDLLYHEATFLHDKIEQAKQTMHSTAHQAATIAKKARVKELIIGHFSSRYPDPKVLLEEAEKVFPNTFLAEEGKKYTLVAKRVIR